MAGGNETGCAYLDKLVPTCTDDDGVLWVGRKSDARNPVGVTLVGDGEFAVAQSVPELDRSVSRSRDDLSVVCGEGDGEDIVGVTDEGTGGVAGCQFPET